jgi:CheY-like chemotaxis protein
MAFDIRAKLPELGIEQVIKMIVEYARKPVLRATPKSIQKVEDFQLAARVELSLLEKGHPGCVVSADGGKVTVVAPQRSGPGKLSRTMHALRWENLDDEVRSLGKAMSAITQIELLPAPVSTGVRTLLVDDEKDYVVTLSDRLQMRDIPSEVAHDGFEALKFVESDVPEVMVLDLRMPGMDGMEVLRRVKRDYPGVEVIVVTGHGSEQDEKLARELGAFDYLQKPVNINVLAERIRAASEKARSGQVADSAPDSASEVDDD